MSVATRLSACLLGACLSAWPVTVLAQHAAAPASADTHGAKAEPPSKHAAEPVKQEPSAKTAAEEPKSTKAEAATSKHEVKAGSPTAAKDAKAEKNAKHDAEAEPAKKTAKAEPAGNAHEAAAKPPASASRRNTDGPRVTVTRVDEQTGTARGAGKPAPSSKLEAALERISDRIVDVRADAAARRPAAKAATERIHLSWRTTLDWPTELVTPEYTDMSDDETSTEDPHVSLVWE